MSAGLLFLAALAAGPGTRAERLCSAAWEPETDGWYECVEALEPPLPHPEHDCDAW